jgi:4-amino-4-deoxychorismate lyase
VTALALLINGQQPRDATHALASDDRGFHYGDGLFETARYRDGMVNLLEAHLHRLRNGCERLGIAYPDEATLRHEITVVCEAAKDGVLKITLTRGSGGRGYRPPASMQATRVIALHSLPAVDGAAVALRWCETRLGRNASLAGIKHLNRLEQVLAQREWDDPAVAEGLMLDTEGEVVSGTMSNLFIVTGATLTTPDLRFSGVRGVMRDEVLRVARGLSIAVSEEPLWPPDIDKADEIFITNAVRGIRPVASLYERQWRTGSLTQRLISGVQSA